MFLLWKASFTLFYYW